MKDNTIRAVIVNRKSRLVSLPRNQPEIADTPLTITASPTPYNTAVVIIPSSIRRNVANAQGTNRTNPTCPDHKLMASVKAERGKCNNANRYAGENTYQRAMAIASTSDIHESKYTSVDDCLVPVTTPKDSKAQRSVAAFLPWGLGGMTSTSTIHGHPIRMCT